MKTLGKSDTGAHKINANLDTYGYSERSIETGSRYMNLEKVVFAFTIILALTLNFGFFTGDIGNAAHHNVYELYAAIFVNAIATILKFGDRTHMGAVLLATSLVANIQLVAAASVWGFAVHATDIGLTPATVASIVSLAGGAVIANTISVSLLVIETVMLRR